MKKKISQQLILITVGVVHCIFLYTWYEFYVTNLLQSDGRRNWNDVSTPIITMALLALAIFAILTFILGFPKKRPTRVQILLSAATLALMSVSWIMMLEQNLWTRLGTIFINLIGIFLIILVFRPINSNNTQFP